MDRISITGWKDEECKQYFNLRVEEGVCLGYVDLEVEIIQLISATLWTYGLYLSG